jgi:hypothetical protein
MKLDHVLTYPVRFAPPNAAPADAVEDDLSIKRPTPNEPRGLFS